MTTQVYDFKSQFLKMQEEIKKVQTSLWEPKSHLFDLVIPNEFIPMYHLFEDNEFDQDMTYTILKKTIISTQFFMITHFIRIFTIAVWLCTINMIDTPCRKILF